jgi:L-ascorbate metabolism protein UlaG (beta-lactamase superfamily)
MIRATTLSLAALAVVGASGCDVAVKILQRNVTGLVTAPREVENRLSDPTRPDKRLVATWVGHATVLVQIDDRFFITDPVFTDTVGQISPRLVEPGLTVQSLPPLDAVLISHMHFDHLSYGSLEMLEDKTGQLLAPAGGLVYIPNFDFPTDEVKPWQTVEVAGMRITAVPVDHKGFRYAVDGAWMTESFTGWVVEYHGITVYFGGDTAYDQALFEQTAARFPNIDLVLMPIAPIEPPEFARPTHVDPKEALLAFRDLKAKDMIPIHYDTFPHGIDPPGYALARLGDALAETGVDPTTVHIVPIGGQWAK